VESGFGRTKRLKIKEATVAAGTRYVCEKLGIEKIPITDFHTGIVTYQYPFDLTRDHGRAELLRIMKKKGMFGRFWFFYGTTDFITEPEGGTMLLEAVYDYFKERETKERGFEELREKIKDSSYQTGQDEISAELFRRFAELEQKAADGQKAIEENKAIKKYLTQTNKRYVRPKERGETSARNWAKIAGQNQAQIEKLADIIEKARLLSDKIWSLSGVSVLQKNLREINCLCSNEETKPIDCGKEFCDE
jgi:hypothetical protein